MWRIRALLHRILDFPKNIRKIWPYVKFYLRYSGDMEYNHIIIGVLDLQLKQITKEIIKDKFYDKKQHDLKLLWECRQALEAYTSGKVEDVASDIDNSLFKKKFKIDIPDIGMECGEGNRLHVTYKYPDTVDEETKKQMDEYLHSKERTQSQVDNFRSLNTAYLQDFLNKLGVVIDSFEY